MELVKSPVDAKKMFRVRKTEVKSTFHAHAVDPVDYCLSCWKLVMGGTGVGDLGIKTMKLCGLKDAYGTDSNEAQLSVDTKYGDATAAVVSSLSVQNQWALRLSIGLCSVWKFEKLDFISVAQDAREVLGAKLKENAVTAVLF